MRNSRFIPMLLLAVTSMLLLTGCHGSKKIDAFEVPEALDESRSYEITFWAKNDTNRTQADIYEKAIRDFEELYPNIKVNLRLYTNYENIYNDVITNIATQTTPNVCITYPDHIATYMSGENVVVPLDSLFEDENFGFGGKLLKYDGPSYEEVIPEFLDECVIGDSHYAIPYMRSTEACYVNKTYVEALGYELPEVLTWDFIWEVSEAAMEKDVAGNFKVNGQNVLIPFIYKSTDNMMIQMLRQLDEGYSDDMGNVLIFNDRTRSLLKEIAEHGESRAFCTFKIAGYPANFLNAGQCIFAVDSTAGATWMGTDAPLVDIAEDKIVDFETVVYPVPQFNPKEPKMISQGPSVCVFNKEDAGEVLASWLFAQYLLSNDVQIAYSKTEGYVPVTSKAQQDPDYVDYIAREGEDTTEHYAVKIQASKLLMDNTENTFVTPVFNGSASLRSAAGALIEESVKSVRRKGVVDDEYLDKLFAETTSLYRLDQIQGAEGSRDLGPLPKEAKALLCTLLIVWLALGIYFLTVHMKKTP